jgi:Ca2+-binding EF-hand superfamily protein
MNTISGNTTVNNNNDDITKRIDKIFQKKKVKNNFKQYEEIENIREGFQSINELSNEDLREIFLKYDMNQTGDIHFTELQVIFQKEGYNISDNKLREKVFNTNSAGTLNEFQFVRFINSNKGIKKHIQEQFNKKNVQNTLGNIGSGISNNTGNVSDTDTDTAANLNVKNLKESTEHFFKQFGFKRVDKHTIKTPQGWRNLLEMIMYFFPGIIRYICGKIVNSPNIRHPTEDTKNDNEFNNHRNQDKEWMKTFFFEITYIFIAAYIANAMFFKICVDGGNQPPLITYIKTSIPMINKLLLEWLLIFFFVLPDVFRYFIYNIFDRYIVKRFQQQPTIQYMMFYTLALFVCSFFMNKMAQALLDVFVFKSSPFIFPFIIVGFFLWIINVPDIIVAIKYIPASIFFIIYCVLHLMFSLSLASIAQFMFVIYLVMFFTGGVEYIPNFFTGLFTGKSIIDAQITSTSSKPKNDFWGKLDYYLHKFIYSKLFLFMFMIFFFYKIMHATIPDTNLKMFKLMASMAAVCCVMFIILAITYFNSFSSTNENNPIVSSDEQNTDGGVPQTVEEIQKFLYPDNPVNGGAAAVGTAINPIANTNDASTGNIDTSTIPDYLTKSTQ